LEGHAAVGQKQKNMKKRGIKKTGRKKGSTKGYDGGIERGVGRKQIGADGGRGEKKVEGSKTVEDTCKRQHQRQKKPAGSRWESSKKVMTVVGREKKKNWVRSPMHNRNSIKGGRCEEGPLTEAEKRTEGAGSGAVVRPRNSTSILTGEVSEKGGGGSCRKGPRPGEGKKKNGIRGCRNKDSQRERSRTNRPTVVGREMENEGTFSNQKEKKNNNKPTTQKRVVGKRSLATRVPMKEKS